MHANDIFTPSSALSRGTNREGPYIMHTDARCPLVKASAATSSAGATSVPARNLGTVSYTHLTLPTICSV